MDIELNNLKNDLFRKVKKQKYMEEKKIDLIINHGMPSFIQNASISSYLNQFFEKYKDSFPDTSVLVHLNEEINLSTTNIKPRLFGKVKNRKLQINIDFTRYQNRGRLTTPSSSEFYNQLEFVMNNEVKNYTNNIDVINPILEARLKQINFDLDNEMIDNHLNIHLRISQLTDSDLYKLGSLIIVQRNKNENYTQSKTIKEMEYILENIA